LPLLLLAGDRLLLHRLLHHRLLHRLLHQLLQRLRGILRGCKGREANEGERQEGAAWVGHRAVLS
jgi:hypothetical protein